MGVFYISWLESCALYTYHTPATLLHQPPAGVEEGAGVEEAIVDKDRQPVVAGRGKIKLAGLPV